MTRPTPLASSAARQLRRDPATVTGSGAEGALRLQDLVAPAPHTVGPRPPRLRPDAEGAVARAMRRQRGEPARAQPVPAPVAGAAPRASAPAALGAIALDASFPPHERVALTSMRRIIAERLQRSKACAPHYYMSIDVRVDALLEMREALNRWLAPALKLSVNDLYVKLVAGTLERHRGLNAAWLGDAVARFERVDLGIAVAIDGGLVTPVLRDAAGKGLKAIAVELGALIAAARERTLPVDALRGATFTMSNLGMYGVRAFSAIIDPPQAAILAIGGVRREALPCDDGGTRTVQLTTLTLSVDHRVADGTAGAEFLRDLKRNVEEPRRLVL